MNFPFSKPGFQFRGIRISRYSLALISLWSAVAFFLCLSLLRNGSGMVRGQVLLPFGAMFFLGAATYCAFRWMLQDVEHGFGMEWGRRETTVHLERDRLRLKLREHALEVEQLRKDLGGSREQTIRLREVFHQLNHPAAFLAPDGVILDINAAASHLAGEPPSSLIGSKLTDLPQFPDADTLKPSIQRACEGEMVRFQQQMLGADQQQHVLIMTLKPVIGERGRVEIVIMEGHDITERIRAEEALQETFHQFQQSQKMEAIGRLAGGIAHDFNNLLTSILGFSNMALESLPPGEEALGDLEEVILAATRAQNLTQKLLALSRKDVADSRPVDLNKLLQEMDNLIRVTLHENIELVTDFCESGCMVLADPTSMEQVILNLAVNARDAMPRSGRLYIRTGLEELTSGLGVLPELPTGAYRVLSVRDTGCGMGPEILEHIFEPFFTTKESGQGTGLGLSTVYAIVKQYKGGIRLWSEPGVGSEFRLYFPRIDLAEQMLLGLPEDLDRMPLPRGHETILLVEDEEGVRRLAAKMIESLGYTLMQACDGEEGIRVAESHEGRIDLIITDVVMPNLSGPEMIDRLRLSLGHIPHLYVSGFTMDKLKAHGADDSEQNLIRKPYSREVLARRIRQALDAG